MVQPLFLGTPTQPKEMLWVHAAAPGADLLLEHPLNTILRSRKA